MANPRHLNNAPITEAVIDIQAATTSGFDVTKFTAAAKDVGYTEPRPQADLDLEVDPNKQQSTSAKVTLNGYRFISADGKLILQMRKNGMTLSRLKPYQDWETFFPETARLWKIYCGIAKPEAVSRIAVRNINRLLFPKELFLASPQRFLSVPPIVPNGAPPSLKQWMTRFLLHEAESQSDAFITQVGEGVITGFASVVLDIDAFRVVQESPDPATLLPKLDALRKLKNRLFFSSLTEEAVDLFA